VQKKKMLNFDKNFFVCIIIVILYLDMNPTGKNLWKDM